MLVFVDRDVFLIFFIVVEVCFVSVVGSGIVVWLWFLFVK